MMYGSNATNDSMPFPTPCDLRLDSLAAKLVKTAAWGIMLLLAVAGNCLVATVLYKKPKLRTIINLFILNMAISDLLLPIFAFPEFMKGVHLRNDVVLIKGVIGLLFCKFVPFVSSTSLIVSYITLVMIAIERFFGIVFPMVKQPIANKKTCYITITLTWVLGSLYSSQFFYTNRIIYEEADEYCRYSWKPAFNTREAVKVELIVYYVCFTVVPLSLITVMYSAIILSLNKGKANLGNEENRRRVKENRLVTFMLMSTTAVCFLTWVPSNVLSFLMVFSWNSPSPCRLRHFRYTAHFLGYCNTAVNPFIYYIFNQHYREGFNEIICFKKESKHLTRVDNTKTAEDVL